MTDIYAYAYGRTRENIVPRHHRHVLIESQTGVPDLVGILGQAATRYAYVDSRKSNPPAAERDRVTL